MNMNFSIDTNVIIGIVNDRDRLHVVSNNLMESKRNERMFICRTALNESRTVFRTKINELLAEIIRFLPNLLQNSKLSLKESHIQLDEIFKQLKIIKPDSINFQNLVYRDCIDFIKREHGNIKLLPSFLSEMSTKYSNSIIKKLQDSNMSFELINLDYKRLSDVKKSLHDIHFNDTNDERIFQELMTNLSKIQPIEFFSDDYEFIKKSEKGFSRLSIDLKYDSNAFSCMLLKKLA